MLKKYIKFLFTFRWYLSLGIPLLVLLFALTLKNASVDGSFKIWFDKDSKILRDYESFKENFSNDDAVTIVFRDENGLFNKKALHSIENISQKFSELDYVVEVITLLNYRYIHADAQDPDSVKVDDFIEDIDRLDEQMLLSKKRLALNDKRLVNLFISPDATTTIIIARLDSEDDVDKSEIIMNDAQRIVDEESRRTGYKFWLNGGPAMIQAFIKTAKSDSIIFTPLVFLLSLLLLVGLFRRFSGAFAPLMVVFLTSLLVLSMQVVLGYKLNSFTINIPVFIVAIGIADAIHIYGIWLKHRSRGFDTKISVTHSLEKNFLAILFTSLTTAVGFASLSFSAVVPIATLGIAIASASVLAFFISIVWLPAFLLLLTKEIKPKRRDLQKSKKHWNYGAFVLRHNKRIILLWLMLMVLLIIGVFRLQVDTNMIRYFSKNSEIRKSAEFVMNNLTGAVSYEMIVDSGKKDGIKEPKFLQTVEHFSQDFKEKFTDVRYIKSIKDIVVDYNKIINHSDSVPKSRELIAQYLLLHTMTDNISTFMDFEQRRLRITSAVNLVNTSQDLKMINYAKRWWENTPYHLLITGKTAMNAYLQSDVANTIIYSLSITLVLVSFMMLLIFRRVKILWILLLPNILPVVLVLGFMGWIGINIDIGVAITGAIIIGVAVDDTIHFLFKYFDAKKRGLGMAEAFDEVYAYAGKAIIFTTLVLSLSFSILIFSDFLPNRNFGIITAFALGIAMILDLFLLPALLSVFDDKEDIKSKKSNLSSV